MNNVIREKPKSHLSAAFAFLHIGLPLFLFFVGITVSSTIFVYENNMTDQYASIMKAGKYYIYSPKIMPLSFLRDLSNVKTITNQETHSYDKSGNVFFIFAIMAIASFLILSYARTLLIRNKDLLGTARWGEIKELKKEGLLSKQGVVFGQTNNALVESTVTENGIKYTMKSLGKLVAHNNLAHSLFIAPTRSGKGISCVVPTCLSFNGSSIIFDPKGELWSITAGYRSTFSTVFRFAPLSDKSIKMNYLDSIRKDYRFAFRDASLIADILLAPAENESVGGTEKYFSDTAKDLLTTTILHVKFSKSFKQKNMAGVLSFLSGAMNVSGRDSEIDYSTDLLNSMIADEHTDSYIHHQIVEGAQRALIKPDRERGSMFATALRGLWLFQDYNTATNTESSDLLFDDFYGDKPISLYLTVPFSDISRVAPLIRLIIQFMVRRFAEKEIDAGYELKNRILFLIDEFPLLGKFDFIEQQLGILAGYNIIFLLIAQSVKQINKLYTDKNPFFDHCKYWVTYQSGDLETAKFVSEMIGKETVYKENASMSGKKSEMGLGNMSLQGSEIERNLLNPDHLLHLPHENMIVFGHGMHPYIAKKIAYYSHPSFKDKANMEHPITRDDMLASAGCITTTNLQSSIADYINAVTLNDVLEDNFGYK